VAQTQAVVILRLLNGHTRQAPLDTVLPASVWYNDHRNEIEGAYFEVNGKP
jgi:hypothetical protein